MFKMDIHSFWQYLLSGIIISLLGFFGTRFMKDSATLLVLEERQGTIMTMLLEIKEVNKNNAIQNEDQTKRLSEMRIQIETIKHKLDVLNRLHKLQWEMSGRLNETDNVQ